MGDHYCHHDELILTDRDVRLLGHFLKWVDVARKHRLHGECWSPSYPDLIKSRLFWWIRSGHEPLPFPPPTAYSCPWYEVVTESGEHEAAELWIPEDQEDYKPEYWGHMEGKVVISQCDYDLIERVSDTELIVGFGPYRWRASRHLETWAKRMAEYNPHKPTIEQDCLEKGFVRNAGWYLVRIDEELPRPASMIEEGE